MNFTFSISIFTQSIEKSASISNDERAEVLDDELPPPTPPPPDGLLLAPPKPPVDLPLSPPPLLLATASKTDDALRQSYNHPLHQDILAFRGTITTLFIKKSSAFVTESKLGDFAGFLCYLHLVELQRLRVLNF
ncbi:hypothetical protein L249_4494 [Ophiocordyceps polyrhachis-furcata BCC 54312]|uniref:Uncharacterized protein n=1 Tax=Ophiocordyceps polyrhachis-furcata BCC 54312 TaxID=1330021 RepID=A0A367KZ24_9HYPO|nr:hypothetical protein L249_4494 [Ophiocordyceps polyrhachis-furcata BCC 54312]